ncbi:MAG TPA: hypothetical protein VG126_09370 [Thermoleophilaceae bacterium]|nr:hypothetical protein [Thermoleophilaceae bacterium]
MRVVAWLAVPAVLAAGALASGGLHGAPELHAVHAQADAIRRADGALLAAFEDKGRASLRWLRPLSLRPASRPLRLTGEYVSDVAVSPDGRTLAVGSGTQGRSPSSTCGAGARSARCASAVRALPAIAASTASSGHASGVCSRSAARPTCARGRW